MVKRKFLISYRHAGIHGNGFGRLFNERYDNSIPSEQDIVAMEKNLMLNNGFSSVVILSISEVAV